MICSFNTSSLVEQYVFKDPTREFKQVILGDLFILFGEQYQLNDSCHTSAKIATSQMSSNGNSEQGL